MKIYKVILVGEPRVGKTSYVKKLVGLKTTVYEATIGCEVHTVQIDDVHLNVWDISGKELNGSLRDGYCSQADAALVMYNARDSKSLVIANNWIKTIGILGSNIPIVLIANKMDLDGDFYTPMSETGKQALPFYPISTEYDSNIREPLRKLVTYLR